MKPQKKNRRLFYSDLDPAFDSAAPFGSASGAPLAPEDYLAALPVSRELPVVCFADAPALPFVPYHRASWKELHGLPVTSPLKVNRKRFHRKPPLTLAACCLLSCTNAVFVTSTSGQATMEEGIEGIVQSMTADEMAMVGSGIR
jgi:hypothetical protein